MLRSRIRIILILLKISLAFFILSGCKSSTVSIESAIPEKQISCNYIHTEKDYYTCLELARKGDVDAAFKIAEIHDDRELHLGLSIKKDRKTAFYWYKKAADLGHEKALRIVFDSYHLGFIFTPKNELEADRYLKHAAELNHQWAMLRLAYRSEKVDPEKAMELYLKLAIEDNCHAQEKLARIYFEGKFVPQDLCKSYFWELLTNVGMPNRLVDSPPLPLDSSISGICSYRNLKIKKWLSPKYIQIVQGAASKWEKGQSEPDFPIIQIAGQKREKISPPDSLDISKKINIEKTINWAPTQIDFNRRLTANLKASEVFNLVNYSVWTVISASSAANLKALNNISIGSAIAISESELLTNYHIIDGKPYVAVKNGERLNEASIISGDRQTDRCILNVEGVTLTPVSGFRSYDNLEIGETVFSVGSPKGLENTLGQGIISGKRESGEMRFIQTTAQISKGSSGGGLFDRFGNLIGITTFKLADSDSLNFAIAIDNFTQ